MDERIKENEWLISYFGREYGFVTIPLINKYLAEVLAKEIHKGLKWKDFLLLMKKKIPSFSSLLTEDAITKYKTTDELIFTLTRMTYTKEDDVLKLIGFFYTSFYDGQRKFRHIINNILRNSKVEYFLTHKGEFILLPFDERMKYDSSEVKSQIGSAFRLNTPISKEEIKQKIQSIYDSFNIDIIATQKTVEKYFNASPSNSSKPSVYRLKSLYVS